MNTLKIVYSILAFSTFLFAANSLAEQTAQCGGFNSSSFIRSDAANVNALMIYTYFPSGGIPGTSDIPSFASIAAQHQANYYTEMSYNTHYVNVQVIQRPSPNQGKAFLADYPVSHYYSGTGANTKLTELNTEILNKAWQENNDVFSQIDVVFMFYGGDIFSQGSGWAVLNHNSSHYSGCGAILEWGYFVEEEKVHKWHLAHEYGHLLSPDGTKQKALEDQDNPIVGIYDIMYNRHLNGTQPLAAYNLIHLGWIKYIWIKDINVSVNGDKFDVVLKDTRVAPPSGSHNVALIKKTAETSEHFLVENRQGTGFDNALSGNGLVIWHMCLPVNAYNRNGSRDVEIAIPLGQHGEDWLDDGIGPGENAGFPTDFFNPNNKSQFTPWTNPSTETGCSFSGLHSPTGLAITNIDYDIGTDMKFDVIEDFDSGDITEDSWWEDNISITGDITVTNNATLTAEQGTIVTFNQGIKLIIQNDGELQAQGQLSNPITLDRSGSSGSWGGVWFYNQNSATLKHLVVKHATYGFKLNANSSVTVEDAQFSNNAYGVYANGADATLSRVTLSNNSSAGITAYTTPFTMSNSAITNSGADGVQTQSSSPDIQYTTITGNYQGVVSSGGTVDLGITCYPPGGGYNSIYNNSSYELWVSSGTVWALQDWWGQSSIPWWDIYSGGAVLAWCQLGNPPPSSSSNFEFIAEQATLQNAPGNETAVSDVPTDKFIQALEYRRQNQYGLATALFKQIILTYPHSNIASAAVWELGKSYIKAQNKGFKSQIEGELPSYLTTIAQLNAPGQKEAENELYKAALKLTVGDHIRAGNFQGAIELCKVLINEFPDSQLEEESLWDLFTIYLEFTQDKNLAQTTLSELEKKYPGSAFVFHGKLALGRDKNTKLQKGGRNELFSQTVTVHGPETFQLLQNYPNPFNPSTTLKYVLPEKARVVLKIYNSLGQEVRTLINQAQAAGVKQVVWDGKDSSGQALSTGLYFYRIQAGQFVQSKKLVLVK